MVTFVGLDMYLLAERKDQKSQGVRGACDGLIPLAPSTTKEEIGYWRKAYTLMDEICRICNVDYEEINCEEIELNEEQIEELLNFCTCCSNVDNDSYDMYRLKDGINYFSTALELMRKYNAKIYFMCWY